MSAAASKASWAVAASIATVEALKDQGICRWNYPMRSLQQRAKNNIRSYAQAKIAAASSCSDKSKADSVTSDEMRNVSARKREESIEKVMRLGCWGPSTTRF